MLRYTIEMLSRLFGKRVEATTPLPLADPPGASHGQVIIDLGKAIDRIPLSQRTHERLDLKNRRFDDLNANKATFVDCDFSYSIFERAYFHAATFRNCKFVGCRFYDSNLRGASFHVCEFKYATFHRTLLEPKEMIAVLPQEPNLKRDSLQNLRANAVEVGDFLSQRQFVLAEVDAAIDHLSRALKGSEDYYRRKYPGFIEKSQAAASLFRLKFGGWIWGHGEQPLKMVMSAGLLILGLSFVNLWSVVPREGWDATGSGLHVLRYCFDLFLDAGPQLKFKGFAFVDYALIAMRYVYIGLFISVLLKSISHR